MEHLDKLRLQVRAAGQALGHRGFLLRVVPPPPLRPITHFPETALTGEQALRGRDGAARAPGAPPSCQGVKMVPGAAGQQALPLRGGRFCRDVHPKIAFTFKKPAFNVRRF